MLRRKQLMRNVQSLTHWLRLLRNELNFPEDIFSYKIVLKIGNKESYAIRRQIVRGRSGKSAHQASGNNLHSALNR
jgi:hypothetical protein